MASFADATFASRAYADFRPRYPPSLYDTLLKYHHPPSNLAIDLGCGPGTATYPLAARFAKVIGSDPSNGMIQQAVAANAVSNVEFKVSKAEDMSFAKSGDVDMVASSQAAHWFDHDKWFQECARVLRKDGTLTYFGYVDHQYVGSELANQIISEFSYSNEYLGPYWEEGRDLLRNLYRDIKPPPSLFTGVTRMEYVAGTGQKTGRVVYKPMTLAANEEYVRTWSAFHNYCKKHKEVAQRDGGTGDIVDRLFDRLRKSTGWSQQSVIEVEWSSVIVLARKL